MEVRQSIFFLLVLALGIAAAAADSDLLRADPDSQVEQNLRADAEDLSRLEDLAMLKRFVRAGLLVPVPAARSYYLHRVPPSYRYLRPWSKLFLDRLSSQFHLRFGVPLRVTSLARTVSYQSGLQRRNENAASAYGEKRSTHLTGSSLDISKKDMTEAQLSWMRRVLHSLHEKGCLNAVEEFYQPAFHVMVYKNYPDYVRSLTRKRSQ